MNDIKPLSDTFLAWGAASRWLNPPNEGQGFLNIVVGKPARCAARFVYGTVAQTAVAVTGVAYHLFRTACYLIVFNKERAWAHWTAAQGDNYKIPYVTTVVGGIALGIFFVRALMTLGLSLKSYSFFTLASGGVLLSTIALSPAAKFALLPDGFRAT